MQLRELARQTDELECNVRTFNYPFITENDSELSSIEDVVMSGVAEVWDVIKKNKWNDAEITENLYLDGHCYGGGIAMLVAAFFKEKHKLNLHVFVDRSYASSYDAGSAFLNHYTGLPLWYAKMLMGLSLYASGDLNSDLMAAARVLDPQFIHGTNLTHDEPQRMASTWKTSLGLEPAPDPADVIIVDGATFMDKLAESKSSTNGMMRVFNSNRYISGHFGEIKDMHTTKVNGDAKSSHETSALWFYKSIIHPKLAQQLMPDQSAQLAFRSKL